MEICAKNGAVKVMLSYGECPIMSNFRGLLQRAYQAARPTNNGWIFFAPTGSILDPVHPSSLNDIKIPVFAPGFQGFTDPQVITGELGLLWIGDYQHSGDVAAHESLIPELLESCKFQLSEKTVIIIEREDKPPQGVNYLARHRDSIAFQLKETHKIFARDSE